MLVYAYLNWWNSERWDFLSEITLPFKRRINHNIHLKPIKQFKQKAYPLLESASNDCLILNCSIYACSDVCGNLTINQIDYNNKICGVTMELEACDILTYNVSKCHTTWTLPIHLYGHVRLTANIFLIIIWSPQCSLSLSFLSR